jgi:hypothetical protein
MRIMVLFFFINLLSGTAFAAEEKDSRVCLQSLIDDAIQKKQAELRIPPRSLSGFCRAGTILSPCSPKGE